MLECRDIDGLMMDFLYEELSESESAHFSQHMAGCARCREEVGAFRRTRDAMRNVTEVEPPAGVTARLLHEAARRAPAPARAHAVDAADGGGISGLIRRFAAWCRPVMLHPAAAAVAALVLVGGVAGALWLRGDHSIAHPHAASEAPAPTQGPVATPTGTGAAVTVTSAPRGAEVAGDGERNGAYDASKGLQAKLATEEQSEAVRREVANERAREGGRSDDQGIVQNAVPDGNAPGHALAEPEKPAFQDALGKEKAPDSPTESPPADSSIEHPTSLKDNRDSRRGVVAPPPKLVPAAPTSNVVSGADQLLDTDGAEADEDLDRSNTKSGPAGDKQVGGVVAAQPARHSEPPAEKPSAKPTTATVAPPPPPSPTPRLADPSAGVPQPATTPTTPTAHRPAPRPATETELRQQAQAPPGATAPSGTAQAGRVDSTTQGYRPYRASTQAEDNWAKAQHGALSRFLAEKKCRDAARIANDILDRNPEYYYQRVEGEKRLGACDFYVRQEQSRRAAVNRVKARRPAADAADKAASEPAAAPAANSE